MQIRIHTYPIPSLAMESGQARMGQTPSDAAASRSPHEASLSLSLDAASKQGPAAGVVPEIDILPGLY